MTVTAFVSGLFQLKIMYITFIPTSSRVGLVSHTMEIISLNRVLVKALLFDDERRIPAGR